MSMFHLSYRNQKDVVERFQILETKLRTSAKNTFVSVDDVIRVVKPKNVSTF